MCGRYALFTPVETLAALFEVAGLPVGVAGLSGRYNVAPTQRVWVVRRKSGTTPERELAGATWGFVPSWSKDPLHPTHSGGPPINARSETAASSPVFRSAFKSRRCLVPADGFYEWLQAADAETGVASKRPMFISMRSGEPLAMGGVWERWEPTEARSESAMDTCAILTTRPNGLMSGIHTRMPVIVPRDKWSQWLDNNADVTGLLEPIGDEVLTARPVSRLVNSPKNDSAEILTADPNEGARARKPGRGGSGKAPDRQEGTLWG